LRSHTCQKWFRGRSHKSCAVTHVRSGLRGRSHLELRGHTPRIGPRLRCCTRHHHPHPAGHRWHQLLQAAREAGVVARQECDTHSGPRTPGLCAAALAASAPLLGQTGAARCCCAGSWCLPWPARRGALTSYATPPFPLLRHPAPPLPGQGPAAARKCPKRPDSWRPCPGPRLNCRAACLWAAQCGLQWGWGWGWGCCCCCCCCLAAASGQWACPPLLPPAAARWPHAPCLICSCLICWWRCPGRRACLQCCWQRGSVHPPHCTGPLAAWAGHCACWPQGLHCRVPLWKGEGRGGHACACACVCASCVHAIVHASVLACSPARHPPSFST